MFDLESLKEMFGGLLMQVCLTALLLIACGSARICGGMMTRVPPHRRDSSAARVRGRGVRRTGVLQRRRTSVFDGGAAEKTSEQ